MKLDKEILNITLKSSNCQNFHGSNCILEKNKKDNHDDIHIHKSEEFKYKLFRPNYHNNEYEYYNNLKDMYINKEEKNINKIYCCNLDIEYNEIFKILYKSKNNDCSNISPFKYNSLGKLLINPNIKLYYKENLFISTLGRKDKIGRIFNNISNNGNFSILFGEKGLEKINFVLALCIYLSQRKIINSYEIFRLYSEIDYLFMINKLNENNKSSKINKHQKKDIIVVKFYNNENIFNKIYQEFCNYKFSNKLYFIFIFTIKDYDKKIEINIEKKELFMKYIEKYIEKKDEINFLKNSYYVGLSEKYSELLLNYFTKDINLNEQESKDLLLKAKNKPKNIKLINILLHQGKSVDEILKMEKLYISSIKLINKSSYLLYYILTIMPSGLPDCFLKLIFNDYNYIIDDKHLIIKHPENNWNAINRNKLLDEYWNESEYINKCYKYLFKSLKLYTQLLNYFIEKNKDKINNKYGNIHYIYNSYSNNDIWKCKIQNTIEKLVGKNIINKDFNIQEHKQNIINLISLIISKIEIFRQIYQIEIDYFMENILLLFPSFFFLKKDNIELLNLCISFCEKLINKTKDVDINLLKRKEYLKHKLLLYLYSIDENKNEILNINNIDSKLKIEIDFLKELRKEEKNIENFEKLKTSNISKEMEYNINREIAMIYFKEKKYDECLKYLKKDIESNNILQKYRAILDFCYVFNIKYNDYKIKNNQSDEINENYKLIKENIKSLNKIIKQPIHKDIYFEAYNLRKETYNLLKPDIIMLNSNPLKDLTNNYVHNLNNQYDILNKLKQTIKSHIRIKYNILNEKNLFQALNEEKGEILIIQSDNYTNGNDIIFESNQGECYIFPIENIIKNLKNKIINYKLIILCFPNSFLFKHYLDNNFNYQYLISFESLGNYSSTMIENFNKISSQFLLDFIENTSYNTNNIENICNNFENLYLNKWKNINIKFNWKKHRNLKEKNIRIKYHKEYHKDIIDKEIYLYDPLFNIDNIDNKNSYDPREVYELIEKLDYEDIEIFHCNKSNKNNVTKHINLHIINL